jgi:hypothetical protein
MTNVMGMIRHGSRIGDVTADAGSPRREAVRLPEHAGVQAAWIRES